MTGIARPHHRERPRSRTGLEKGATRPGPTCWVHAERQSTSRAASGGDVNIRDSMNTFLTPATRHQRMPVVCRLFAAHNPHVLPRLCRGDRVLAAMSMPSLARAKSTSRSISARFPEGVRCAWADAPAFGLYPIRTKTEAGSYKLRKRTFVTC